MEARLYVVMRLALAGAAITAAPACDRVLDLELREVVADAAPLIDAPSPYVATVLADEPIAYLGSASATASPRGT